MVRGADAYVSGLFRLAHDPAPPVRLAVCTGIVALLALAPEKLEPHAGELVEYMLGATQDADEGVALAACEFWAAYPESALDVEALRPALPRLLPVLLRNMVRSVFFF
jgi:transportin-1